MAEKYSQRSFKPKPVEAVTTIAMAIEDEDPLFSGGMSYIRIQWADQPLLEGHEFHEGYNQRYRDESDLIANVETKVRMRRDAASSSIGELRKELKNYDIRPGKDKDNPRVKEIKRTIEKLNVKHNYAFRHIKVGRWQRKEDALVGRFPPGFNVLDEITIKAFSSQEEIQAENEEIYKQAPVQVRSWDGQKRAIHFDWRPIDAG